VLGVDGWRCSGEEDRLPNTRIPAIELQLQILFLSPAAPAASNFIFLCGRFMYVHYLAESYAREIVAP
jgi:hypothetical protein